MIRQLEMDKCFADGQLPCRWTPDLGYQYGYPLFNFYPPLPYLAGHLIHSLGFSYMATAKLTILVQFIAANLAMYLLAASLFGPVGAFFSSLFFTYAPYHALNIYVRGAINEAWAAIFFPLIFYFSKRLVEKTSPKNLIFLSLSLAGLLLSHNPMAITFAPIVVVWTLFWLLTTHANWWLTIRSFFFSGLLTFGLVAFFSLPVVFETNYVQIDSMFQGYFNYAAHFTSAAQLFISNFWGDGPSIFGPHDGMSFFIGYLHWLLPLAVLITTAVILVKKKKITTLQSLTCLLILMGFATAFLTHERSVLFWKLIPILPKIQFPWRLLNHTVFLFSLSIGILPNLLANFKFKNQLILLATLLVIIINAPYFYPVVSGPLTDSQKFSGKAWNNLVTSGIYDYLPKTARIAAQSPANFVVDRVVPATSVTGQKQGTDWLLFNLHPTTDVTVTLAQLYFPNFKIYDNGQSIPFTVEPELGRMVIKLSPGEHLIYAKLTNTPIRTIANTLSLITWLSLFIYLLTRLWNLPRKLTK